MGSALPSPRNTLKAHAFSLESQVRIGYRLQDEYQLSEIRLPPYGIRRTGFYPVRRRFTCTADSEADAPERLADWHQIWSIALDGHLDSGTRIPLQMNHVQEVLIRDAGELLRHVPGKRITRSG